MATLRDKAAGVLATSRDIGAADREAELADAKLDFELDAACSIAASLASIADSLAGIKANTR